MLSLYTFLLIVLCSISNFLNANDINLCYNLREFNKVKALAILNLNLQPSGIFNFDKLLMIGKADFYSQKFVSAQRYFQKALKVADDSIKKSVAGYWLGRSFLEQNSNEKAVDYFNQIIQYNQNPEPDFLFYYGIALYRLGRYPDALNCFLNYENRTKPELHPKELPFFIGVSALCSQNFELSEKYLISAISRKDEISNPKVISELLYLLSLNYYLTNNKEHSINILKNLNVADQGLQNKIKLVLGTLYSEKKDYKNAIKEFNTIVLDTLNELKEQVYFRIGFAYLKMRQPEKALQYFDSLIINYPNSSLSALALYNTGKIYQAQNKSIRAKRAYRKLLATYPDNPLIEEATFNLANILYQEKNYLEAVTIYEKLLKDFLQSRFRKTALFNLAYSYYNLANINKAQFYAEQYTKEYPNSDDAFEMYYILGKIGAQNKDYNYAIQNFSKITQGNLYAYALKGIADIYFALDSLQRAVDFYNLAEKNSADTLLDLVRYNREAVYLKQGVYPNEIIMRKSYLEKYPQSFNRAKIQYEIGHYYYLNNKFDTAIVELEKVRTIDTISTLILNAEIEKSQSLALLGDTTQAINNYLKIIQEFPNADIIFKPLSAIAHLYYSTAQYDSAIIFYNWLIRDFPNANETESGYRGLAKSYYSLGRTDEAIKILEKFKQKYPHSTMLPNVYLELVDYYIEMGKYTLAENTIKELFRKIGKSGDGFFRLGTIYKKRGKLDEALNYFINAYNTYRQEKSSAMLGLTLYEAGNVAIELKKWQRAKEFFERCLKESEDERLRISAQDKLNQIQEKLKD
ncbi:MAG: tetratricopeptide repeat protein [candidate division WOR-3 bacterium]|nr:tetratricopeptide repeat protein [candidate division WOR-3 bacterium]